ncbi:conjugal transfer protein TraB [Streptomyces sp. SR27]|uniref:conjugal transfer protein TraB n=1 Tax=Streptomyces sp. SR27 TaxID=3076630 RepID=UPI00295AD681|nr:conjugal transfer protein TraB [Streptomyces sp. SR27]MDV9191586.1 conjugal transfer protein TraB [Streptomyces sp. SR27]
MTELEPYTAAGLPAESSGRPSFLRLAGRITTLVGAAAALTEGLWVLKRRMEKDADAADRLAEQCAEAEVEPRFTALITDAASALRAVAESSGELAGAADVMAANARDFGDAHDREYRGVYEAVQSSGVQQAKPGFYEVR